MCGRTTLTITADDLKRTFGYRAPAGYRPSYNISPTQDLLALADRGSGSSLSMFRWGLIPFWAKDMKIGNRLINARSETISSTPAYRAAFAKRRCLVIVDGYYEWKKADDGKRPYRVCFHEQTPFTLAGVWERWYGGDEPVESCSIVTTDANAVTRSIHDRMPVVVAPDQRDLWLSSTASTEDLTSLLRPYGGDDLVAYEVSTLVNSPSNDRAECIEPMDDPLPML